MARAPRRIARDLPHHIVHRGNNRRRIVSYASDFWRLLDVIAEAALTFGCQLHAFALMSNHLHLLATPPEEAALPRFVKRFAQRYAVYRNRRRGGTGKLWEQRYRCFLLDDDEALAVATGYIDLNPVRAGMLREPFDYRWSSARLHLGQSAPVEWRPNLWTPSPWYRGLGDDSASRAGAYAEWLVAARAKEPTYADELREIEALSSLHYARRLLRPDGTSARDPSSGGYGSAPSIDEPAFWDGFYVMGQDGLSFKRLG